MSKQKAWSFDSRALAWVCGFLITPFPNYQRITIERDILAGCLMGGVHIKVGEIIKLRAKQDRSLLPFPVPISVLCFVVKVPFFPRVYQ